MGMPGGRQNPDPMAAMMGMGNQSGSPDPYTAAMMGGGGGGGYPGALLGGMHGGMPGGMPGSMGTYPGSKSGIGTAPPSRRSGMRSRSAGDAMLLSRGRIPPSMMREYVGQQYGIPMGSGHGYGGGGSRDLEFDPPCCNCCVIL